MIIFLICRSSVLFSVLLIHFLIFLTDIFLITYSFYGILFLFYYLKFLEIQSCYSSCQLTHIRLLLCGFGKQEQRKSSQKVMIQV